MYFYALNKFCCPICVQTHERVCGIFKMYRKKRLTLRGKFICKIAGIDTCCWMVCSIVWSSLLWMDVEERFVEFGWVAVALKLLVEQFH